MQRAVIAAADSLRAKPDERDILFVVRKDPVKFARIKELLRMQQLVKQTCNTNDPEKKDAITTVVCLSKHLRPDLTDSQFKQAVQREEDVLQQGGWVNSELETFVALLAPKPPDAAGRVVVEPVSMRQAFWGKAGPRGFPLVVCMPPPLHQSAIGQLGVGCSRLPPPGSPYSSPRCSSTSRLTLGWVLAVALTLSSSRAWASRQPPPPLSTITPPPFPRLQRSRTKARWLAGAGAYTISLLLVAPHSIWDDADDMDAMQAWGVAAAAGTQPTQRAAAYSAANTLLWVLSWLGR
ncbi:uncharacterized protein HaLaN_15723 [Haematococcus lacustris]|uniref:Uncharacterized protein n=1 Tax=Haematococcus lacustris TaxID=44745 RepID=A0A699ZAY8_HAELA|nr:uncharacterized protein HaLaN_15723 [Haematococcus lacustris]